MKKKNMQSMVRLMLTPVLMVILGIVLVVRPELPVTGINYLDRKSTRLNSSHS